MEPTSLPPILCAPLLRVVDRALIDLLSSLAPEDWDLPTIAPAWRVRDVAAHLLDTTLRKLSLVRDAWVVERPEIHSPNDVALFVNRLNAEGVAVLRRLSPQILIPYMQTACEQSADFHEALDPFAPAAFSVSWAGESSSLNWFDTARELTERWHHQQQIRLAANRPGIMTRDLYHPVLDCFLRGLPFAYRHIPARVGASVHIDITGDCGGRWQLLCGKDSWQLTHPVPFADARIAIPQQIAWRVFTRGIDFASARSQVRIEGDESLALPALRLTAIVATS